MIDPILAGEMRIVEEPRVLSTYHVTAKAVLMLHGDKRNMPLTLRLLAGGANALTLRALNEGDKVLATGVLKTVLMPSGDLETPVMQLVIDKLAVL